MVDSRFCVEVISQTPNPQQTMYAAMHQDYAEVFVAHDRNEWPSEERCGPIIVNNLLKGGRGHYGCYDAKTEVLTGRGWLAWPFVMPHHKLLAVDIESGTCRFEQPSALQRIACHGDRLYGVSSAFLDFRVTLDHRMVVSHRKKTGGFSDWYFSPASDVIGRPVRYLLNSCLEESSRGLPDGMPENIDSLTAFKVAGFFFGDGVRSKNAEPSCVRFRIRRPKKVAYLLSLGLKTFERKGDRFTIEHQSLARWIHANFSGENGKVVPEWILTLPEAETAAFWDGLKNSDGTRITNKSWAYDSCEKEALDLIQAAAHINGFSANMTLNNPNDGIGHNNHEPCWRLTISEHSTRRVETSQGRSPGITETQDTYTGHVYCATVSTGALMVRRNNKAFVSGNCLEHPQIVFNVGWFPHSTMQQIRTHRVGVSFDVQCLAGNTRIKKWDGEWITIKDLFDLQEDRRPLLRSFCEETRTFTGNPIGDVFQSGVKNLYRMTLANGNSILASADHRFLSADGWKRMHELCPGQKLVCNGRAGAAADFYTDRAWLSTQLQESHPMEIAKSLNVSYEVIKKYAYKHGLTWEKRPTGIQQGRRMPKWSQFKDKPFTKEHVRWWMKRISKKLLNGQSCYCCGIDDGLVLHHVVPVDEDIRQAYNYSNLMTLCRGCHASAHAPRLHPNLSEIASIEAEGDGLTYDISMGSSIHNFVAEGIVTHNSFRYTGQRILDVVDGKRDVEEVFYLRPLGDYSDRQGKKYEYTTEARQQDLDWCLEASRRYKTRIEQGFAEEHARGLIPFDIRQHWVMSANVRSIMHILDLRWPANAQLEAQKLCDAIFPHFELWVPAIAEWYMKDRAKKSRLSP
jgi:thymidylate synthase (FAD)